MSPISDLVIRIKNGYMADKFRISSPYSKFREQVLKKLAALGYVQSYSVSGDVKKTITIELVADDSARFTDVQPVSTPGQRMYVAADDLKPVMSGLGYAILSTPKGIMTNIEAKKAHTGGELLFRIW